jgi:hypothetical protein
MGLPIRLRQRKGNGRRAREEALDRRDIEHVAD